MALAALVEEAKNQLRLELPRTSDNKQQKEEDFVSHSIVKGKRKGEERKWRVGETNLSKREKR